MSITVSTYDRLYVGGEWVAPLAAGEIDVVNPYTEEVIGRIPAAGAGCSGRGRELGAHGLQEFFYVKSIQR